MKKIYAIVLFFVSLSVTAQDRGTGIGVILGSPTGISLKHWVSPSEAMDFGLGYSLSGNTNISLHADYLHHVDNVIKSDLQIPLYYGAGLRLISGEHIETSFGVRGVVGLDWMVRKVPVDVFFEVAPVFKLLPSTSLDLDAGLGARYFF